jgi:hypothetical protein
MNKVKIKIDLLLKRLNISKSESPSIRSYWKLIMISHILVAVFLVVSGWMIYAWVITTTPIMVMQKKQRPPITLDEIETANSILEHKKGRLDAVIVEKIDVVDLK